GRLLLHRRGDGREHAAHRCRGGPPQRPGHGPLRAGQPGQEHRGGRDPVPEPGAGPARDNRPVPYRAGPLRPPRATPPAVRHRAHLPSATSLRRAPVSITRPRGFRAVGLPAGLKSTGAADLALVVNDGPRDTAAAVFTANRVQAAPVLWSREAIADG